METSNLDEILRRIVTHIEETDKRHTNALNELRLCLDGIAKQGMNFPVDIQDINSGALRDIEDQVSKLSERASLAVESRPEKSTRQKIEDRIAEMSERLTSNESSVSDQNVRVKLHEKHEPSNAIDAPCTKTENGCQDHCENNPKEDNSNRTAEQNKTLNFESEEEALEALAAAYDLNYPEVDGKRATYPEDGHTFDRIADNNSPANEIEPATGSQFAQPSSSIQPVESNSNQNLQSRFAEIADRLEDTLNRNPRVNDESNQFSDQLGELSSKFEIALGSEYKDKSFNAIQNQIQDITSFVERVEGQFERIDSIESNMIQLMEMMKSSEQNADGMARTIAEETATAIISKLNATGPSSPNIDALNHSIKSLAQQKAAADNRNADTLDAIHSTLRHMVSRLELIESELSDNAQHDQYVASGENQESAITTNPQATHANYGDAQSQSVPPVPQSDTQDWTATTPHRAFPADPRSVDTRTIEKPAVSVHQPAVQAADVFANPQGQNLREQSSSPPAEAQVSEQHAQSAYNSDPTPRYDTSEVASQPNDNNQFVAAARRAAQAASSNQINNSQNMPQVESLRQAVKNSVARQVEFDEEEDEPAPHHGPSTYQFALASGAAFAFAVIAGLMLSKWTFGPLPDLVAFFGGSSKPSYAEDTLTTGSLKQARYYPSDISSKNYLRSISDSGLTSQDASTNTSSMTNPETGRSSALRKTNVARSGKAEQAEGDSSDSTAMPPGVAIGSVAERSVQRQLTRVARRQRIEEITSLNPDSNSYAMPSIASAGSDGAVGKQTKITTSSHRRTSNLTQSRPDTALPPAQIGPLSLRLAAAKGSPTAEYEIGARFAQGKGVKADLSKAADWFKRSASKGYAPAQYRLATLYERGLGTTKDLGRAKTWYRRAAEQGNIKAMHNLAVLHTGREGEPADYSTAAQWFNTAATYGLADSQYNLAILYQNGMGVGQNLVESYKWLTLAAIHGDDEAGKRRESIRSKLTQAQIAAAEREALSWTAKRSDKSVNSTDSTTNGWNDLPYSNTGGSTNQSADQNVLEVQQFLKKLGYDPGPIDGHFGPKTRSAIKTFQQRSGMKATGKISPELVSRLAALAV